MGSPPGFGPTEPASVADMFSTPPREDHTVGVSDSSAACHLKSFTRHVLKKVDSSLIWEPPKRPLVKPVLPMRSKRLVA